MARSPESAKEPGLLARRADVLRLFILVARAVLLVLAVLIIMPLVTRDRGPWDGEG
jgi:hypothetical protein